MKRRRVCPELVANACLAHAWDDACDDESRALLERAHDVIKNLMARCIATSKVLEVVEAEMASMKFPLLGDEDPGLGL
jgi:hypothetical protein